MTGPLLAVVTAVVGAGAGWFAGSAADAIATPRYGPGAEGHDPEDLELALLDAPTTRRSRIAATIATAGAFALLAVEFDDVEVWLFFAVLVWAYVVAALIDLQYLRLPDPITKPAAVLAALGAFVLAAEHAEAEAALWAIGATAVTAGLLWLFSVFFRAVRGAEAFGLGDVKLQLSLGASVGWLGWEGDLAAPGLGVVSVVIWAALAGFLVGSLAGLPAAGFKLTKHIPFGPFLMVGWFAVVLLADSIRG